MYGRHHRATHGVAAIACALLLSFTGLPAAHLEDDFELGDGFGTPGSADILGSETQPGCDWADLFDADPTPEEIAAALTACGGVDAVFLRDQLSQGSTKDDTSFAKGSSKNDDPVATWAWTTGGAPSKADLSNVYALATLNDADELVLYAGIERLTGSGDSHIDIELNQNPVDLDKDPPCGDDGSAGPDDGSPCEFTGGKTDGDLLIVMDFAKGGTLGLLEVREWVGSEWVLRDAVGGEGCNDGDTVCALNNAQPIDGGPWDNYDSRGRVIDQLETNAFTEAAINVTRLLGRTPCFVSFLAKSRSSSSFTSELKDFVRSEINICSFTITKGGSPVNPDPVRSKVGDPFVFRYEIENTGAATLYLVSVVDSLFGDITDDARNAGFQAALLAGSCDPLAVGDSCTFEKTLGAIPDDADDPFETNVTATYTDRPISGALAAAPRATLITVSDSDTFPLDLFQPSVDVEKTGDTLSTPGNTVRYRIDVVNTSSADSPDLGNAVIVDTLLGDLLDPANPYVTSSTCGAVLPTGGSCFIEAERTVLPDDPDPLGNTVTVNYNPVGVEPGTFFPNDITDNDSHGVDLVYPSGSLTVTGTPTAAYVGDTITYVYVITNTGDVPLIRQSVSDTLLGDLTELFPDTLAPGESVEVSITRTILDTDADPVVNTIVAIYTVQGLPGNTVEETATFSVDVLIPCAKSPGFWKGGEGVPKWDDILSDPVAQGAGFDTGTLFPWLDASLVGSTYLDVLNLSALGDVTRQLSFKYVAARLNESAFGVPEATAGLLDAIDLYFVANPVGSDPQGAAYDEGSALLDALNAYFAEVGEDRCPPSDAF